MDWVEKISAWFQTAPREIAQLPVRRITLDQHPPNIAVFEASSLHEACLKADAAMRQKGVQGAVWVRNESGPLGGDRMAVLTRLREHTADPALGKAKMRNMNGVNIKTLMLPDEEGVRAARFEQITDANPQEILEPLRLSDLDQLSRAFGKCSLSSRYELREVVDPHYDHYERFGVKDAEEDKIFMGRTVRILVARHQPSVVVYDTDGKNPECEIGGQIMGKGQDRLKEAWQPAVGDYIFTCALTWGLQKALPHSSPDFQSEQEEDCRILDVYDVGEGFEIARIEQAVEDLSMQQPA